MPEDVHPDRSPQARDARKVAIACQGGGTHTAFTAGVLQRLLAEDGIEIRALSGTSGGAVCAALAWSELVAAAREPDQDKRNRRLKAFWDDNTTPPWQVLPWSMILAGIRLVGELGLNVETSPYHVPVDGHRMFLDLIEKHVPFGRLTPDHLTDADPRLLISASDVRTGEFRVFRSHTVNEVPADRIGSRTILASAALPTIFHAVALCDGLYWDGLSSQNPPCRELIDAARRRGSSDGPEDIELWVIQINPQERLAEPTSMDDIRDRRNELIGNISYQQEIFFISKINEFVRAENVFTAEAKRKYGTVKIRCISMSREMASRLDYESKLDRNPGFLDELFRHGHHQADGFLKLLESDEADTVTALPDRDIWGSWKKTAAPCLDDT